MNLQYIRFFARLSIAIFNERRARGRPAKLFTEQTIKEQIRGGFALKTWEQKAEEHQGAGKKRSRRWPEIGYALRIYEQNQASLAAHIAALSVGQVCHTLGTLTLLA